MRKIIQNLFHTNTQMHSHTNSLTHTNIFLQSCWLGPVIAKHFKQILHVCSTVALNLTHIYPINRHTVSLCLSCSGFHSQIAKERTKETFSYAFLYQFKLETNANLKYIFNRILKLASSWMFYSLVLFACFISEAAYCLWAQTEREAHFVMTTNNPGSWHWYWHVCGAVAELSKFCCIFCAACKYSKHCTKQIYMVIWINTILE